MARRQVLEALDPLHAPSAAAADRLDQQRHADAARQAPAASAADPTAPPGTTGTPRRFGLGAGAQLVPTASICAAVGPMKMTPCVLAQPAPARPAPTGSHSPDEWRPPASPSAACTIVVDLEITLARPRRTDADRAIGEPRRHESRSASEAASTVSMPSRRQVRMMRAAISPRLAIRMRRMAHASARLADAHQRLAVFDERAVLRQDLDYRAARRRRGRCSSASSPR